MLFSLKKICLVLALLVFYAGLASCGGSGSSSDSSVDDSDDDVVDDGTSATDNTSDDSLDVDIDRFYANSLTEIPTLENCTLSDGTETTCWRITVEGIPFERIIGPFCPETILDTAEDGGIWFDGGGEIYDIDGDFIVGLADLYGDSNWLLYDPDTGDVNVTDTQVACEAAARPNVDPDYQNHCVECKVEYISGGQPTHEFLIPTTPVPLSTSQSIGNGEVGLSYDGIILEGPAPVAAILSAYTIAAFDDCAGHVNPVEGYHYHGHNGCSEGDAESDGHAPAFAYALDGYAIHAMLNEDGSEPTDLDSCRGHSDEVRGYHYHAASAAENMFIGCYSGATAQ